MSGTLFVVGTPIGNLEDLTFRALRTLKEVDLVAAEDTRRTSRLLAHYAIRKPLTSLHEHNELREIPRLLGRLKGGESIALVTDAGTPGIADPGARLVAAVHRDGHRVVPIPGPSAVATALSVSGFSADEFVFMGFPPRSGMERERWFQRLKADPRVIVFFEAPHRIQRTLVDFNEVKRPIVVLRELTKLHEEVGDKTKYVGDDAARELGEFTLVVGNEQIDRPTSFDDRRVVDIFGRLTTKAGFSEEVAYEIMDKAFHLGSSMVRKAVKRHSISVKRQSQSSA
jgi:16S rRNA (cytidine1402-2'-O)-methyltransferase